MDKSTPISEIMTKNVIVGKPTNTTAQLRELFMNYKLHHLVVTEDDGKTLAGIVSSNDLMRFSINNPGADLANTQLKDIMTTNVVSVSPSTTLEQVVMMLQGSHFSAVPVVENGNLVGIFTLRDLARVLHFIFHENYNF